jgi:hypothetical protein
MNAETPSDLVATLSLLKALGPTRPGRILATGWRDGEACGAIVKALRPTALSWMGPPLNRPGKTTTEIETLESATGGFDLIVAGPGLGDGSLAAVQARIAGLGAVLAPDGVALFDLETLATPATSGSASDILLFPALAQTGALGPEARNRAVIGPANLLLMLQHAGMKPEAVEGYGASPPTVVDQAAHATRLAIYDEREIATPRLRIRAVRTRAAS